jgi:hypothetical protein
MCSRRVTGFPAVGGPDGEVVPFDELVVRVIRRADADRREHRLVEAPRGGEVRDPQTHVIEHATRLPQGAVFMPLPDRTRR